MTDARHEQMTMLPPEAAGGHRGSLLRGLVGGALIGTAAGVLFAPRIYAALSIVIRGAEDVRERATEAQAELEQRVARTHTGS